MTKTLLRKTNKAVLFLAAIFYSAATFAQDSVTIKTGEVKSWFEEYWLWVAVGVVVIILLALMGGSRRKVNQRKTTTVVKDPNGNVKSVTTTEDTV